MMLNCAHGRVEDVRGRGYYSTDGNRYHFREIRTFDNRYLIWGYGGDHMQGQNDGNYSSMPQPAVLGQYKYKEQLRQENKNGKN